VEMKKCGYLGPYEWKILDRISIIEVTGTFTDVYLMFLIQLCAF
jgi:hypothetical protein